VRHYGSVDVFLEAFGRAEASGSGGMTAGGIIHEYRLVA
jgi:hypothetical protein